MGQKELPAIAGPIIVIVVGLALLVIGYFDFKKISNMKNNGIKTEATITNVSTQRTKSSNKSSSTTQYTAYVTFITKKGEEIKASRKHNGIYDKSDINSVVKIYYDPVNPNKIIWEYERGNIAFLIIGIFFFVLGILIVRQMKKKKS